jgi:phosphohistidine phosphatase
VAERIRVIYLVHHADAVGPEVEPQRPLSIAGRMHAESLANDAAGRGVKPDAIWHSGKLRARQTAEPFLRLCNPLADFAAIRGLQPTDPPEWIRDLVAGEQRDVMLVGHMPSLPRVLTLLVNGRESSSSWLSFPLHGAVALEPSGDRWIERWRM